MNFSLDAISTRTNAHRFESGSTYALARRCGRWPSPRPGCRTTCRARRTACTDVATKSRRTSTSSASSPSAIPLRGRRCRAAILAECQRAGIRVLVITGDDVQTARAIGHDIGLVASLDDPIDTPVSAVLTSRAFNELDDDALKRRLPDLRIIARARPLDKYRLVRLLQEMGEVVAVTGDGTNDAPALKKADVGLAMGIAGTEVAKAASKIVLLDDSFRTIVRAVGWGRSLYENIQRFLQFQLTINVSALAITFLGILLFDVRAPFTVLQLLWINVIMDTFASIALCSEPPRDGLMLLPPKRRGDAIVTPAMRTTILLTAAFFVVVMLGLLLTMKGDPNHPGLLAGPGPWAVEVGPTRSSMEAKDLVYTGDNVWQTATGAAATVHFTVLQATLFFTLYVFFQIWNEVNCRSLSPTVSGLSRLRDNPVFLAIVGVTVVGQVLIVTFGHRLFQVQPLTAIEWVGIVAASASVVVFAEIVRRIRAIAGFSITPRSCPGFAPYTRRRLTHALPTEIRPRQPGQGSGINPAARLAGSRSCRLFRPSRDPISASGERISCHQATSRRYNARCFADPQSSPVSRTGPSCR